MWLKWRRQLGIDGKILLRFVTQATCNQNLKSHIIPKISNTKMQNFWMIKLNQS